MRNRVPLVLVAVASLVLVAGVSPSAAHADDHVRVVSPHRARVFVGGYFGPYGYYPWAMYPYWGYPPYPYGWANATASVRVEVQPKTAQVYVDGHMAGIVDRYDGFFQSLPVEPGPHDITVYQPGFHSITQRLYLSPGSTYHIKGALEPLAQGEANEPPPMAPARPAAMPSGSARMAPRPWRPAPGAESAPASDSQYGRLAIRAQPSDAEVRVDGETWQGSPAMDRLFINLSAGSHQVEVRKDGFVTFTSTVQIRPGDTTTLNVSLSERR